jgi:small subunit ribosomal protein S13
MEQSINYRHIIRIANSDLKGDKNIAYALRYVKGVGFAFSNAICRIIGIDARKKTGELSDAEIAKIEAVLKEPLKAGVPAWMLNRKKDPDTGIDKHLFGTDVKYVTENDIKMMKKIKCYKGVRHSLGLPTRGQRTRSNFRKNKGNVLGVRVRSGAKAGKV